MDILFGMGGTGQAQGGGLMAFLPFILIMLIIYFLMIRPQTKRQKEKQKLLEALKKGDKVVTVGGLHGTIGGFKNQGKVVVLKVDKNTNMNVTRSAIAGMAGTDVETEALDVEN